MLKVIVTVSLFSSCLLNNLLYKAEKPSLRPSVCLSVRSFLVEWISVVGARISVKLARKEAPVLWGDEDYF